MDSSLRALALSHGGPFTRQEALRCGYTDRELKTLTGHRGAWVVLRRGVYAEREAWETLDEDGRYSLLVRGTALVTASAAAFSHGSAAALLGMPLRPRWREVVHLTRPDVHGGRGERGVRHHRSALPAWQVDRVGELLVTTAARTGLDLARDSGFEDGVVALDAALRRGATHEECRRVLLGWQHWPGVARARRALDFADPGAENPGESILRVVVGELCLGEIETQFRVTDGVRTAYADLRVERHLFEFDGQVKYRRAAAGGVADRPPEEVVWEEKQREDWLRRVDGGYGVSRVVWSELFGAQRRRTQARLREEFAGTMRRFGPTA